jgi:hypothetical protein
VKNSAWLLLIFFTFFSAVSCSKKTVRPRPVMVYEFPEGENKEVVLENDYLLLRFVPETAEIILTEKNTGVQWRSNPPGYSDDPVADVITKYLMGSQLSLEYADNTGVGMTLFSSSYSVDRLAYEYEVVDGDLEVRYTVGDISRAFRIPPAMPEERMLYYLDMMSDDDRPVVESCYRLYDIDNLRSTDDRTKLLADYPDLSRMKLYVLRGNTQDYMKEDMEDYFKEAGYTYEEYFEDISTYSAGGAFNKPAFSLTLRYSLEGKSLVVNVPFDKIAYLPAFPILRLSLLPFMGAGGINDEGYMLVPDSSGALIYFNNKKQTQTPYSIRVYGWDEAMPRDAIVSDNKALFPAFGIHKNGSAMLCVIEEGSSYASVRADVSGRNSSWNMVYPLFDIVHGAKMDITGRNERDVYLYESSLPAEENITLRYTLCEKSGYMGMAQEYRSWLLNKYPSLANRPSQDDVPIAVEIIGAVNKTQHRLGLPVDLPLKLTSYKEVQSMIDDFGNYGWKNLRIKLNGWFNRSVDHSVPTKVKLISQLGSKKDFKEIVSAADKNNFQLHPEADFFYMKDVKSFSGFNIYRDAARYVNRERIQKYPFSFVWFGERKQWGKLSYIARPSVTIKLMDNFFQKTSSLGLRNIAFRNYGSKLAGDYHEKRHVSREASMLTRQKKLQQIKDSGKDIIVNTGFVYAAPWADLIIDMIIDDQSFGITDASVPFLPIVLHGVVPYTSRAINLAEDYTKNLLKTVESGAGLYFSFMKEETAELQETKFRQFYANEYDKWVGDADAMYKKFTADFGHLYSQKIVDHVILSPNVTITEYEDGTRVLVNASDFDAVYDGINIGADTYRIIGGRE